jgi:hypothetical protein
MPLDATTFDQQDAALDVLRRMRELVSRPSGWWRRCRTIDESYCLSEALLAACSEISAGGPFRWDVWRTARTAICALIPNGDRWFAIIDYNDARGRTQEEVVGLLDRAIAMREGK